MREGHAWVGVSAQQPGVKALADGDAPRYGSLNHPGDRYSFDIFTQAGRALTSHDGAAPLGRPGAGDPDRHRPVPVGGVPHRLHRWRAAAGRGVRRLPGTRPRPAGSDPDRPRRAHLGLRHRDRTHPVRLRICSASPTPTRSGPGRWPAPPTSTPGSSTRSGGGYAIVLRPSQRGPAPPDPAGGAAPSGGLGHHRRAATRRRADRGRRRAERPRRDRTRRARQRARRHPHPVRRRAHLGPERRSRARQPPALLGPSAAPHHSTPPPWPGSTPTTTPTSRPSPHRPRPRSTPASSSDPKPTR